MLKKFLAIFILLFMFPAAICHAAEVKYFYDGAYHTYEGNIFKLKVDNKILSPEMPPIVFSDYSVVPARSVFQDGLGATVEWNATKRQVSVTMDKTELLLTIDKKTATINGTKFTMPIAPKIINDYTMIPVRFVAENLGMTVDFDNTTDTIIINSNKPKVSVERVTWAVVDEEEVSLVITTDKEKPEYKDFLLREPDRLVIDVLNGVYKKIPTATEIDSGNVTNIRFGQNEHARIVIDMTENIGYSIKSSGKKIYLSIKTDPELSKPKTIDIFKEITYGSEGGRDYIKFNLEKGKVTKKESKVTIPVYSEDGTLPEEPVSKKMTSYFCQSMDYEPGNDAYSGTITIHLKTKDTDMYEQGNEVRFKSIHKALKRSVMLDAGHGGMDGGAVAYNEDGTIKACEKDFNLDIALRAQKLLEAEGVDVHMIRTKDVYVDFLRVGSIANDAGTSLFVSIHTNSALSIDAHGIETYGYLNAGSVSNGMTSERLSEILLEEMIDQTDAYSRGVKDGKELAVINSTKMPATLIEIGFISNEEECEKMMTASYRQKLAQAVCDGVLRAFDEMDI